MKFNIRHDGAKGYHLRGSFRGRLARTISTRQVLFVVVLVGGAVLLLTWGLCKASGAV